ncbi:MAG: hypothetical protein RLY31_2786 [Bacteroidota bacterium]
MTWRAINEKFDPADVILLPDEISRVLHQDKAKWEGLGRFGFAYADAFHER